MEGKEKRRMERERRMEWNERRASEVSEQSVNPDAMPRLLVLLFDARQVSCVGVEGFGLDGMNSVITRQEMGERGTVRVRFPDGLGME